VIARSLAGRLWRFLRRRQLLGLLLGFLAVTPTGWAAGAAAQTPRPTEYQIKAVFLYNFARFVSWPDRAFSAPDAPLVIGVLGDDPFGPYLDETVKGESVNQHPLMVQRFREVEQIVNCHILFVSRRQADRLSQILAAVKGRKILTVGDAEGFASKGGMIRFMTDHNRIKLRINLDAARADDLVISSKLLRPAEIVSTGGE
jgi:hypothetical protein